MVTSISQRASLPLDEPVKMQDAFRMLQSCPEKGAQCHHFSVNVFGVN
jgi:hypothetical protein